MEDEIMGIPSNTGKYMKQYFVNFSDGTELHAWIFLTTECHLVYGHTFTAPDGKNEYYTSAHERDFFEFTGLDETVMRFLKTMAMHAKAILRVIDFPPDISLEEQYKAMESIGVETKNLQKIDGKYEEIKMLDRLWEIGETKMEEKKDNNLGDCSSIDWLMGCVHKWEEANKSKGRIVEFFGSFFAIDSNEGKIKDDRVFAFGLKKTILNTLSDIRREIKKEKEDFVNW